MWWLEMNRVFFCKAAALRLKSFPALAANCWYILWLKRLLQTSRWKWESVRIAFDIFLSVVVTACIYSKQSESGPRGIRCWKKWECKASCVAVPAVWMKEAGERWGKIYKGRQRDITGRARKSYPVQLLRRPQPKSGVEKLVFTWKQSMDKKILLLEIANSSVVSEAL